MTKPKPKPESTPDPDITRHDEVYKPMATPEPSPTERLEALELQVKAMKDWINKHNRTHFGRDAV